jgi:hypothetical protein
MDAKIDRLLNALRRVSDGPPHDLAAFVRQLPEPGALPSPWETWTLIGLARHRERQNWVAEIIRTRLGGNLGNLAGYCSMGPLAGVPRSGSVPGLPEWEYYFHGIGCCITHKVRGDAIDVDFFGDSAECFDWFFYANYLDSLREPDPVEQRLRDLHQKRSAVRLSMDDLLAAGALTRRAPDGREGPPRVAEEVLACEGVIEAFCRLWASPGQRLWLAAVVGDWPAAREAVAGRAEVDPVIVGHAESCLRLRRERLRKESGYSAADALYSLAELGDADEFLEEAFRGPPDGVISAALEIAGRQGDSRWCPHIYALFCRLNSAGQIPEPRNWLTSLKYLLHHGYRKRELLHAIARAGDSEVGEGVLLALEHAPEHALPLVRKALLADIPVNRTTAAAILALIARPWTVRELLRALEESDDQQKTADARAALLELGDAEAEKAVLAWQEKNPHEEEPGSYLEIDGRRVGPFYSFDELSLKNRASRIQYEMDKLHDRVVKLRDVVPPEPADRP